MPSLGAVASHIHIQFDDVNPDVDVQPPGNALLASMPDGSIGIYAAKANGLQACPGKKLTIWRARRFRVCFQAVLLPQ